MARCCGAKHMSKSKCTKLARFGPLLEVEMWEKCTSLHIFNSKCAKHITFRPLLDIEMFKKCMPVWGEAHVEVKV